MLGECVPRIVETRDHINRARCGHGDILRRCGQVGHRVQGCRDRRRRGIHRRLETDLPLLRILLEPAQHHSRQLQEHPVDVGLHLTLTGQQRLTAFCSGIPSTLHALTGRALSRRLAPGPVRIEIRAQLDAFEDAWDAGPDYIDGHQHIHCLPVIRNELLDEVSHRYGTIPWIRDCTAPLRSLNHYNHSPAKEAFLSFIGHRLSEEARNRGFRMNDSFRGLYTFTTRQDYGSLFHKFLSSPTPLPLVHCHPGWVDSELRDRDTLTWPREREFAWLTSGACQEFMERTGIYPSRFPKQSPDGAVCA